MIGLNRAAIGGLIVAVVISLTWGLRVDSLRAGHKARSEAITAAVAHGAGLDTLKPSQAISAVRSIVKERDQYRANADNAKQQLDRQGQSIRDLAAQSARQKSLSAEQRARIAELLEQRDAWIARAEAAATRTERLAAEQEARICGEVADALYNAGF